MVRTILFDMDGTLIDTEKYYRECWPLAAADCGIQMSDEQALSLRSLGRPFSPNRMKEMFGMQADYKAMRGRRLIRVQEKIEQEGLPCKSNAAEAISLLRQKGYRVAVCTATDIVRAKAYLDQVQLGAFFDTIVCATMVRQGKPSPEVYRYACESLGVAPEDVLAVEDAPNGIMSAYGAGCHVAMIPDQTNPGEEAKYLDFCFSSLMELAKNMPDIS